MSEKSKCSVALDFVTKGEGANGEAGDVGHVTCAAF